MTKFDLPMTSNNIVVIDGLSGCGKTSLGLYLSKELQYGFYDAGVTFRAIAAANYLTINQPNDSESNKTLIRDHGVIFKIENNIQRVFVGELEVTEWLHKSEISQIVPDVSKQEDVRDAVREVELSLAETGNYVICGRNLGRYIFPKNKYPAVQRIWVDVPCYKRAEWRQNEHRDLSVNAIESQLHKRDKQDMERSIEPVRIPTAEEGYHFFYNASYSPEIAKQELLQHVRSEIIVKEWKAYKFPSFEYKEGKRL